jgi:hypothetical protein
MLSAELANGIFFTSSKDSAPVFESWSCVGAFCSSSSTGFFLLLGGIEDLEDE